MSECWGGNTRDKTTQQWQQTRRELVYKIKSGNCYVLKRRSEQGRERECAVVVA